MNYELQQFYCNNCGETFYKKIDFGCLEALDCIECLICKSSSVEKIYE